MNSHDFVEQFPVLFHLTYAANWSSIRDAGLLTTEQIARQELPPEACERFLSSHRPERRPLGRCTVRDQRPLQQHNLTRALEGSGLTNGDWIQLLNARTFFFPTWKALLKLWAAYADERVLIIELNTSSLLQVYEPLVELSTMNTGAVRMPTHKRNRETFAAFSKAVWDDKDIAEVIVVGGVPDLLEHARYAYEIGGGVAPKVLHDAAKRLS